MIKIFIVTIEGLDKSGKFTQTKMLAERLQAEGYKVATGAHHLYGEPIGDLIMKWLKKEWDVDQTTIELMMAADKQSQQNNYNELEHKGYDFLILDRYMLSQLVYSAANGIDISWTQELQKYMRKPDLDIVIDIPAEVSMKRKGKHNDGKNDRYESDLEMLERVRYQYIMLPEKYSAPLKLIVDGEKPVDEIHEDIYYIVVDNLT